VAPIAAAAALTAAPVGPPAPEIISAAPAEPPIADAHPAWSAQPHTITAANAALGATLATVVASMAAPDEASDQKAYLSEPTGVLSSCCGMVRGPNHRHRRKIAMLAVEDSNL
jgi:hypothetical protein